jgi:two-component system sensor histidine kinase UhpB
MAADHHGGEPLSCGAALAPCATLIGMWPRSLPWRLFAVNALLLGVAWSVLVFAPVSISASTTASEIAMLAAGTAVLLAVNLAVVRRATAPLLGLTDAMAEVDPLEPGQRVEVTARDREVASLVDGFNGMLERLEDERRRSSTASLRALERERLRVARDLHDGVGQSMTALLLVFDRLARGASNDVRGDARSGQELTRHALEEVRTIVDRLRPDPIEELGLAEALRSLVDRVSRHARAEVVADVTGELPALDADAELAIYRIAQEAITNALRHAGAQHIALRLTRPSGAVLELEVADDGRGLQPGERGEPGHGLRGMRERAVALGATLAVRRGERGGTRVRLTLPVDEEGTR